MTARLESLAYGVEHIEAELPPRPSPRKERDLG
jgi:hypothetical protein